MTHLRKFEHEVAVNGDGEYVDNQLEEKMHPEEGPGHEEDEGGAVGEILPKGRPSINKFGGTATIVIVLNIPRSNTLKSLPSFTKTHLSIPPRTHAHKYTLKFIT